MAASGTSDHLQEKRDFYERMKDRWARTPPTVQGMMGDEQNSSQRDIETSDEFLNRFFTKDPNLTRNERVLDGGCGIGRVTKHILLKYFKSVVVVDQDQRFLDALPLFVGDAERGRVKVINRRIQSFPIERDHYDAVWLQWILGYLTDDDCVITLQRLKRGLRQTGVIFVKEFLARNTEDQDGSKLRTRDQYEEIFEKAGLQFVETVHSRTQTFDVLEPQRTEIEIVEMYALIDKVANLQITVAARG